MTRRTFFLAGILALAASAHLAQQNPQSNGATIRGIVTREGSSEPIPDVLISLTGSGARAAAIRGGGDFGAAPPVAEGTRTDKEGRFTIAGVLQGNYNLQASLDGYFGPPTASGYARAASRFITVSRPSEEVNLSLVKGAVISGRAVDANGRPALGSAVQALRLVYRNGAPNLQSDGSGPVDDRGEYRIFQLPPGEYYICLIPSASGARGFAARGGVRGESGEISQPTYFPGTTDPLQALPLKVNPGEERTGVNLNLRTAMTVRISGQVLTNVAIPGRGGPRGDNTLPPAQLTLVPRDLTIPYNTTTRSLSSVQLTEPARGRFEINGVVPGKYDLFASVTNANAVAGALNETRYFAGRVAVDVGLQNLENVSVAVGQPLPLKIRVTVNGSSTIPPETIRVQAQPADASFSVGAYTSNSPVGLVAVDAQGELTIPSLHEALYRFQVLFSPYSSARPSVATDFANVYVDDIRQGGISVYDSGVEVSKRDLGPVEMLVKTNGGAIDGIVNDALGVGQPGVAVVLAPPENRRRNPALYKTVTTTAAGRFSIRGIPPGSYELFAWPSVPTGAYQSPEFIAKDEQRGRQVLVNASSTTTVDLNLITPALR